MSQYALIAEFDSQQTVTYRQSVERHAIEPVLVGDGIAASRVLQSRGAPVLLICDVSLPRADGFSVIAELRRLSPPDRSAILVFSEHVALRTAAVNLQSALGIAEVGEKNQPPETIADTIDRALERVTRARSSDQEPSRSPHFSPAMEQVSSTREELANHYRGELAAIESPGGWRSRAQWAALERLALTDSVTGLFNRHAGELALEREVARAKRTRVPFSLALIDVDHFKQVNDRHGHAAGDEVLKQVSSVLTSTFRASDLAVRWGGDEFLVFLPDVSVGGAMVFAERARSQVESLFFESIGAVTLSAGIVQVQPDEDARTAVRRADAQLYEAKRSGRNLVRMAVTSF